MLPSQDSALTKRVLPRIKTNILNSDEEGHSEKDFQDQPDTISVTPKGENNAVTTFENT